MIRISFSFRKALQLIVVLFGIALLTQDLGQAVLRSAISYQRANHQIGDNISTPHTSLTALSQRMTALFPEQRFGYRMLGYGLLEDGNREDAISVWCKEEAMPRELFYMGQQARRAGRYADAGRWYRIADQLKPGIVAELEAQVPLYYYAYLEKDIPSIEDVMGTRGLASDYDCASNKMAQ